MDKEEHPASDSYVSPYLLRPLRSISQAMSDRGTKLAQPAKRFEAANAGRPEASDPTIAEPSVSPRSDLRTGAAVVWLPNRRTTAGRIGRPDP